ncbi:MAG: ROK family protein [Alphaproteobacteria bacterium]|nr:ROK family protein [Alphaproteobacteria bacterium]
MPKTYKRILAFDIGGTGLKAALVDANGHFLSERLRVPTPHHCNPAKMLKLLAQMAKAFDGYDAVAIGFPGYVKRGVVHTAPNLGTKAWAGFPLEKRLSKLLGKPTRLRNDADVQGLAAISGNGLELVVTLGTGFGTAWFHDGALLPHLEFAHVPVHHKHDFDGWIGEAQRLKIGHKKWNKRVKETIEILETVFNYDHLYIGGGNANRIDFKLPAHVRLTPNEDGMAGAAFVWNSKSPRKTSGTKKSPGRQSRRSKSRRR